jgi:hypothetical protein
MGQVDDVERSARQVITFPGGKSAVWTLERWDTLHHYQVAA